MDSKGSDRCSLFYDRIFAMNTGKLLSGQEIRARLCQGSFDKLIAELSDNVDWRAILHKNFEPAIGSRPRAELIRDPKRTYPLDYGHRPGPVLQRRNNRVSPS
jgi:hypothetical protein